MRLLASQLRDIVNAVQKNKEDVLFGKILQDCLESASYGKEFTYIDLEYHKYSKDMIKKIVERLRDYNYMLEVKYNDEDGYADITVRW